MLVLWVPFEAYGINDLIPEFNLYRIWKIYTKQSMIEPVYFQYCYGKAIIGRAEIAGVVAGSVLGRAL